MKRISLLLLTMAFFQAQAAPWDEDNDREVRCFDFSKPIEKPLEAIPEFKKAGQDYYESGEYPDGSGVYSVARAVIKRPIASLMKDITNKMFSRNADKTTVDIETETQTPKMEMWLAHVKVNVVAFVSIGWDERKQLLFQEGTKQDPKTVFMTYEKVTPNKNLRMKCGHIRLKKIDPNSTDYFQFEKVKSTHWNLDDMKQYGENTVKDLRNARDWEKKSN